MSQMEKQRNYKFGAYLNVIVVFAAGNATTWLP